MSREESLEASMNIFVPCNDNDKRKFHPNNHIVDFAKELFWI